MRTMLPIAVATCALTLCLSVSAQTASGKTYTVSSGMSIQAVLDKAQPGDTVQVLAGDYFESLIIHTENVSLIGLSYEGEGPVLNGRDNVETLERAIAIAANGVTVKGFVIQEFTEAGVVADAVNDVTLADLIIRNTGVAGIVIDDAVGVTLQRVVVSEMTGVSAYILESISVSITDSEFLLSPYGLVLADCLQSTVQNSGFYRNAVGVIVASRPDGPKQEGDHLSIRHCRILENKGENTYPKDQLIAGLPMDIPGGIGIVILGADHTVVSDSIVVGNASCGIATYAYPGTEAPSGEAASLSTAGVPDHTYVHHNVYRDNGSAPSLAFGTAFRDVEPCDLYWDGTGIRNQWQESAKLKTHPENLTTKAGGVHTDVIHFL